LAVFGKPRYLGLVDIGESKLDAGRWIVVKTLRGVEMGLLGGTLSQEQEVKYRSACLDESSDDHTRGPEPMLQEVEFVEPAGEAQIKEHNLRRRDEEAVLIRSRQILRVHQVQMKLVDVEYTMDRKKLFFYFTSEQRVDFRAYVRDLAKEFRIRIEMRQIGVRDEAKTVRGVSPCGRPCCCSYWLHRFTPINIRMVKEQNLALNPTKISGICGRLMCCMFYEHPTYSELWKNLPSPGSKIKAPQGNYVMEGIDLRTETVRVSFPEGGDAQIPVADFARFKETILRGEQWQREEKSAASESGRTPLSRGPLSRIPLASTRPRLSRGAKVDETLENAKNNRKLKPEKISIDEHIAERTGEVKLAPPGEDAKGYQRRLRGADAPSQSKREVHAARSASSARSAQGAKDKDPRPQANVPREQRQPAERPRPQEARGEAQARAMHTKKRPEYKGGNRGQNRPPAGNAGGGGKGRS
jgi:cell fate regulator YaaT (PSP1 superfamily)